MIAPSLIQDFLYHSPRLWGSVRDVLHHSPRLWRLWVSYGDVLYHPHSLRGSVSDVLYHFRRLWRLWDGVCEVLYDVSLSQFMGQWRTKVNLVVNGVGGGEMGSAKSKSES